MTLVERHGSDDFIRNIKCWTGEIGKGTTEKIEHGFSTQEGLVVQVRDLNTNEIIEPNVWCLEGPEHIALTLGYYDGNSIYHLRPTMRVLVRVWVEGESGGNPELMMGEAN